MDNVKSFFKDHPASKVVFSTADNMLFKEDGDAALHAKSLGKDEVKTHKRSENESEAATEEKVEKPASKSKAAK